MDWYKLKIISKCISIRFYLSLIILFYVSNPIFLQPQSLGPKKENEGEHLSQKHKLKMLNPGFDRLDGAQILEKWRYLQSFNAYSQSFRTSSVWENIGPFGHESSQGFDFFCSGRVRDVEVLSNTHIRVVSASGGLWDIVTDPSGNAISKNMSDHEVLSSWGGTVATDPFDENVILFGTGEPGMRGGTGLWRTQDRGITWKNILLNGGIGMGAFDEMEFTNQSGKVWTSGSDGVFYSENSGQTWSQKWGGNCQGMVVFPNDPKTVLVGDLYRGIYKTTDGGTTWNLKTLGLPTSDFGRIELSNCKSQPNVIYALYTTINGFTKGIYKSIDSGENWIRCTVFDANGVKDVDYHWGMAHYCSFISVSPTNPNHVISGGGWYIYSIDGQNFTGPIEGQHVDFHTGGWNKDGSVAYYGNDGGIYKTPFDLKWKWDHKINRLPITQFVTVAVARTKPEAIIGGTQDNGFVYHVPSVKKWVYHLGDGGGVSYHPKTDEIMYGTIGVSGGSHTFRNVNKKGPFLSGWTDTNIGLEPSGQWWRLVRTDRNEPPLVYTQTDNKVYYSENNGSTWIKFFTDDINIKSIESMRVSHGEYPKIYASGDGPDTSRCMVLDAAVCEWKNITKGLPLRTNSNEYSVPHEYVSENILFPDRVYALMRGYGSHIKNKVLFRSENNGNTWTNISNNLPELPYTVMMEHPINDKILIAGTDGFGVFITDDGGKVWQKWDTGLPKGAFISDLDFQKYTKDTVYVVMSTYGHGLWRRLLPQSTIVSTQDPTITKNSNIIRSSSYDGSQFLISFSDALTSKTFLKVVNMEGRRILSQVLDIGATEFKFDAQGFHPGVFVVSLHDQNNVIGTTRVLKH